MNPVQTVQNVTGSRNLKIQLTWEPCRHMYKESKRKCASWETKGTTNSNDTWQKDNSFLNLKLSFFVRLSFLCLVSMTHFFILSLKHTLFFQCFLVNSYITLRTLVSVQLPSHSFSIAVLTSIRNGERKLQTKVFKTPTTYPHVKCSIARNKLKKLLSARLAWQMPFWWANEIDSKIKIQLTIHIGALSLHVKNYKKSVPLIHLVA